jgi:hypothetical protein
MLLDSASATERARSTIILIINIRTHFGSNSAVYLFISFFSLLFFVSGMLSRAPVILNNSAAQPVRRRVRSGPADTATPTHKLKGSNCIRYPFSAHMRHSLMLKPSDEQWMQECLGSTWEGRFTEWTTPNYIFTWKHNWTLVSVEAKKTKKRKQHNFDDKEKDPLHPPWSFVEPNATFEDETSGGGASGSTFSASGSAARDAHVDVGSGEPCGTRKTQQPRRLKIRTTGK